MVYQCIFSSTQFKNNPHIKTTVGKMVGKRVENIEEIRAYMTAVGKNGWKAF